MQGSVSIDCAGRAPRRRQLETRAGARTQKVSAEKSPRGRAKAASPQVASAEAGGRRAPPTRARRRQRRPKRPPTAEVAASPARSPSIQPALEQRLHRRDRSGAHAFERGRACAGSCAGAPLTPALPKPASTVSAGAAGLRSRRAAPRSGAPDGRSSVARAACRALTSRAAATREDRIRRPSARDRRPTGEPDVGRILAGRSNRQRRVVGADLPCSTTAPEMLTPRAARRRARDGPPPRRHRAASVRTVLRPRCQAAAYPNSASMVSDYARPNDDHARGISVFRVRAPGAGCGILAAVLGASFAFVSAARPASDPETRPTRGADHRRAPDRRRRRDRRGAQSVLPGAAWNGRRRDVGERARGA